MSNGTNWDFGFVCNSELINLLNGSTNHTLTEEIFNQFCKINEFVEPSSQLPSSLPPARLCYPQISSCLELDTLNEILAAPWNSTYYHSVSELCRESHFQNPVTLQGELDALPFRNEYCALGNGVDITDIECFVSSHVQSGAGGIEPFAIILDLFARGRVAMGSQRITRTSSIQFGVSCSKATEVYDPAIGKCHPTVSAPVDDGVNSTNASSCSEKLITLTDTDAFEYVSTDMQCSPQEIFLSR